MASHKIMFKRIRKAISIVILVAFISTSVKSPAYAQLASVDPMPYMPKPGVMVHLSSEYTPAYLKGIVIHPENALKFDFIIYKGDKALTDEQKRVEYTKLTKYFLASLAIPDDDQWVNLSPYEKDRIIKDDFGKTEMGRDLLAQDYMLKQITASLIYPEDNLGKKFWDRVYTEAQEQYGTTNIPVNTFNKVWILPDDALIYEKGNTAYVLKNHLRVMLEEDYLSLRKHSGITSSVIASGAKQSFSTINTLGSKIVREIVLPELQREVNEDKNFAPLRQVYSGMLLAAWYKHALKESLLGRIYMNKSKLKGVDQDPKNNEEIYRQYLKAYKKGVFNFIKEDVDKYTNETIPRKYFSGGFEGYPTDAAMFAKVVNIKHSLGPAESANVKGELPSDDYAQMAAEESVAAADAAQIAQARQTMTTSKDAAMMINLDQVKKILSELDAGVRGRYYYGDSIIFQAQRDSLKTKKDLVGYIQPIIGRLVLARESPRSNDYTPIARSLMNEAMNKAIKKLSDMVKTLDAAMTAVSRNIRITEKDFLWNSISLSEVPETALPDFKRWIVGRANYLISMGEFYPDLDSLYMSMLPAYRYFDENRVIENGLGIVGESRFPASIPNSVLKEKHWQEKITNLVKEAVQFKIMWENGARTTPTDAAMVTEQVKRELEGLMVGHSNVSVESYSDKGINETPIGTITTTYTIYPEGYDKESNPTYYTVKLVTGTENVMNGDQNRLRITIEKQEGKEAQMIYRGNLGYDSSDAETIVRKAMNEIRSTDQIKFGDLKELADELKWTWARLIVNSIPDKEEEVPTGSITTTYTIHLTGYDRRVPGNDRRYTIDVQSANGVRIIFIKKWKVTERGDFKVVSTNRYVDGVIDVGSIIRKVTDAAMTGKTVRNLGVAALGAALGAATLLAQAQSPANTPTAPATPAATQQPNAGAPNANSAVAPTTPPAVAHQTGMSYFSPELLLELNKVGITVQPASNPFHDPETEKAVLMTFYGRDKQRIYTENISEVFGVSWNGVKNQLTVLYVGIYGPAEGEFKPYSEDMTIRDISPQILKDYHIVIPGGGFMSLGDLTRAMDYINDSNVLAPGVRLGLMPGEEGDVVFVVDGVDDYGIKVREVFTGVTSLEIKDGFVHFNCTYPDGHKKEYRLNGNKLEEVNNKNTGTSASVAPGGIDFNSANLNLQIKRDGHGVPLPISQQDLEHINIDGLIPIIIDIRPATSLPIFSELQNTAKSANI